MKTVEHGILKRLHFSFMMIVLALIELIMITTFAWGIYWIITGRWIVDDLQKIADKLP